MGYAEKARKWNEKKRSEKMVQEVNAEKGRASRVAEPEAEGVVLGLVSCGAMEEDLLSRASSLWRLRLLGQSVP